MLNCSFLRSCYVYALTNIHTRLSADWHPTRR